MATPSLLIIPDRYKAGKLYSQLPESGAGDLDFSRASTATRVNASGLIESVASGVPRLDYSGGGCPSLLLEPQRTNVALYSEEFNNAVWQSNLFGNWSVATVTPNTSISPDGTMNADTISLTSPISNCLQRFSVSASTVYTYTIYVKAISGQDYNGQLALRVSTGNSDVLVDENFQVLNISSLVSTNEWKRFNIVFTVPASGVNQVEIGVTALNIDTINANVLAWGAQLEEGAYPTSYIPTTASSVTRLADVASKTGISSLIGVNQGTIYLEFDANGVDSANYVFDLSDDTNFDENRIAMYWTSPNNLQLFYGYGGTFASQTYNFNFLTTKKIGVRWTSTEIQAVINGLPQTAVTYGNSSPTKLNLASRFNEIEYLSSNIKTCALYNNTLSTAELISLTTL